ncbi:MAG: FAD-dependent oxidoreductase, partial [Phycisphaerae bacterium]|nr:FAD-dependent oxidoreductase [Phycisphaerae bacterium]
DLLRSVGDPRYAFPLYNAGLDHDQPGAVHGRAVSQGAVEGLDVKNAKTGETKTIPCDGVFVLIGHVPNTGFLRGVVEMNESGHILTDEAMATSAEGIYACGDVRREWFKQMVTACGEGAIAAYSAQRYIEDKKGTAYPGR